MLRSGSNPSYWALLLIFIATTGRQMISLKYSVLNALRHQRNWNTTVREWLVRKLIVLNALRHQRNWNQRLTIRRAVLLAVWCSTPYGIKGIGTIQKCPILQVKNQCSTPYGIKGIGTCPTARVCSIRAFVLNALRHQRNWNNIFFP